MEQQEDTTLYDTEAREENTQLPCTSQCGSGLDVGVVKTAWYSIQGTGGVATVTTAGSAFDTILFAYAYSARGRASPATTTAVAA